MLSVAPLSAILADFTILLSKFPTLVETDASLNLMVFGELCSLTINENLLQSKYAFKSSPVVVSILENVLFVPVALRAIVLVSAL